MRRLIVFSCHGDTLVGTIDEARGTTGLLIVSGGNEVRGGAHRGMAMLAARLAASGTPVFRYDRRGVGDSAGVNLGYRGGRDDLIAAASCFRANAPQVDRLIGFGNCDAATALAMFGRDAGLAAIVLANPWTIAETDPLPPAAAIRAHYAERLLNPATWGRMLIGDINLRKLASGLRKIVLNPSRPATLADEVIVGIRAWGRNASVVLAQGDATAIAYADAARRAGLDVRTTRITTASHSFARPGDADALETAIRSALTRPR